MGFSQLDWSEDMATADDIMTTNKPKSALIAYCVLADRLKTPGMGIVQAMTPFLAEACSQLAGELFDASKFSAAVSERFGIRIPRLAALGLTDQLAREGILTVRHGTGASTVYQYAPASIIQSVAAPPPVTEAEVEAVLQRFINSCQLDTRTQRWEVTKLQSSFFERLLNLDSMRLLSRREVSIAAKRTPETLLKKTVSSVSALDADELHLDFLVSQFLLDLRHTDDAAFESVSNIAFASMAAEAIAVFQDPPSVASTLEELTVYLDSPLLLDMMGVNIEYAEYGQELLEAIKTSGAKPAVFDHCIAEAESAIHAQLSYLRSGVNQVSSQWGTSAKPDLLAALVGKLGERAEARLGVSIHRDPEVNLHRRAQTTVGDIEAQMTSRMQAWGNHEAKEYDRKSVWAMLAMRDTTNPCPRLCDTKTLLLTRNTPLVKIANGAWRTWLRGSTSHSTNAVERWAPVAVSDKQFAGYLWTRSGGVDSSMSKARLLAHCSAAVRPRADIKARAYNMVLELNGRQEADDLMALFEDREGAGALMRATRGDPEDVTLERMPFILEQVKLAAGKFAADEERLQSEQHLATLSAEHADQFERLRLDSEIERKQRNNESQVTQTALIQEQQEKLALACQNKSLRAALAQSAAAEDARRAQILRDGHNVGVSRYRTLRWLAALAFGFLSGGVALTSSSRPELAAGLTVVLSVAGFWFVPDVLHGPLQRFAGKRMAAFVSNKDPGARLPAQLPDFRNQVE